jgi:hypothetical protein
MRCPSSSTHGVMRCATLSSSDMREERAAAADVVGASQ